mgnify:CR=1 FL=1
MERPIFIRDTDPLAQGSTLVVGIDKKGKIIRFNDTLEQFTGSVKKDVLDVPFATFFSKQIPKEELENLVKQARYNPDSLDLDTSFRTVHGDDVLVSWTGFALKNDEDGRVSQLNLVGTPQKQTVSAAQSKKTSQKKKSSSKSKLKKQGKSEKTSLEKNTDSQENVSKKEKESKKSTSPPESKKQDSKKNKDTSKTKSKKTKNKNKESKSKKAPKENKTLSKNKSSNSNSSKNKRKKIKIKRKSKIKNQKSTGPISTKEDPDTTIPKKLSKRFSLPKIQKPRLAKKKKKQKPSKKIPKISLLSKKSEKTENTSSSKQEKPDSQIVKSLQETIKQLQEENKHLQKENEKLDENLHSAELKKIELKDFFHDKFRFIRDSVGIKKKREEFKQMMQQLSERKQKLEKLETEMVLDKKEFKQKIDEFIIWREKLEKLEQEIEKRRQFLSEQETFLNEQYDKVLSHELTQPATYTQQPEQKELGDQSEEPGILEKDDLFNSLTVEAAVLQRGRIKKANKRFAEMLGYPENELVGKHLVDFVGPSGLSGVEQHYMNRLKGVDDASYQTVFLSKLDDEIPVKVHVKTGDFQGERAEIATFNEI